MKLCCIEEDINEEEVGYDEMSLEALEPHPNLKALCLKHYGGVRFPFWLSSLTNLVQLKNVTNANICHRWINFLLSKFLDSLGYISERDNSEEEFSHSSFNSFLPSLERLKIENCPNLKRWWQGRVRRDSVMAENHSLPSFPRLSKLYILGCPQLTSLPLFPYLDWLRLLVDLSNDWDEMEWQGLRSLLSLEFYNLPKLVSLPGELQHVTSLQRQLDICPSLMAIPGWIYDSHLFDHLKFGVASIRHQYLKGFVTLLLCRHWTFECPSYWKDARGK
ncbi:putative disease resistance protein rga4 [Quercus suber]|uniref:Disease resistance protein rga4 n=1 Tax=Quercus suber TaxID=58331 RepID=A0AAW0LCW8_QUESU